MYRWLPVGPGQQRWLPDPAQYEGTRGSELLHGYLARLTEQDDGEPWPTDREIDALWFTQTTGTTPAERSTFTSLTYTAYLQTPYWKRVRAALLLIIQGARCRATSCYFMGESWYGGGWETDLHVHHLRYRLWGTEQYHDLALLCREHHDQWHAHQQNPQDHAPVELADGIWG